MTDDDIALKAIMAAARELGAYTLALPEIGTPREKDPEAVRLVAALRTTVQDALAYAGVMKQLATIKEIRRMNGKLTWSEWAGEFSLMGTEIEADAATLREKLEVR